MSVYFYLLGGGKHMNKRFISLVSSILIIVFSISLVPNTIVRADDGPTKEQEDFYYGYNVTSGISLLEPDAINKQNPIIDLESDYYKYIKYCYGTKSSSEGYTGTNLYAIENDFAYDFSSGTFGRIYRIDANLRGSFKMEKANSNTYSEYFEMVYTRVDRYHYELSELSHSQIRQYLDENFRTRLYNVKSKEDAIKLYNDYGTHLSTGYMYGGVIEVTNYSTTTDSTVRLDQGSSLEEKVTGAYNQIEGGQDASFAEKYTSQENNETTSSTYNIKLYGGTAVAGIKVDHFFTYNDGSWNGDGNYTYLGWINSINANEDLTIVGIPQNCDFIPLWDLLDADADPEIKNVLVEAYTEMCGDKYDEYLSSYPTKTRTQIGSNEEIGVVASYEGAYVKTANGYTYHVDKSDLNNDGDHQLLHPNEYLYLELSGLGDPSEYEFETVNCEVIDKGNAVFKVGESTGRLTIQLTSAGNEQNLVNVNVEKCDFEGGMGTKEYPYLIVNADQFQKIKENGYYQLENDIDFSNKEIMIDKEFKGELNGNYYTLSKFKLTSEGNMCGLFRSNSGTIKNLRIDKAGTCLSVDDYNESKDKVEGNGETVAAQNAGIFCAINSGTIENCFVSNTYICNVDRKLELFNKEKKSVTMSTGVVAGVNDGGIIIGVNVEKSYVLSAFVDDGDQNTKRKIYVYSGGLVGLIKSGTIEDCVVNIDESGEVNSFTANNNGILKNDNEIRTYAAGLAGYVEDICTIKNTFICVDASNIVVDNKNYGKPASTPSTYHCLKSACIISRINEKDDQGKKDGITLDHLKYKTPGEDLEPFIKAGKKDGKYPKNGTYTVVMSSNVSEHDSKKAPNEITESKYYMDNKHILSQDISKVFSIEVDDVDYEIVSDYCKGDNLTFSGLRLNKYIDGKKTNDSLLVFCADLMNGYSVVNTEDLEFTELGANYSLNISMHNGSVCISTPISIEVGEVVVSKYVVEGEVPEVYLDDADSYLNTWTADEYTIFAIMSDGEKIIVEDEEKKGFKLNCDELVLGENEVTISKINGSVRSEPFIIHVLDREILNIEIVSNPTKMEYDYGEKFDPTGLEIRVNYDAGDSKVIQYSSNNNDIEVVGKEITTGNNTVYVTYEGYSDNKRVAITSIIGGPAPTKEKDVDNETVNAVVNNLVPDSSSSKGSNVVLIVLLIFALLLITAFVLIKTKVAEGFINKFKKNR